MSGTWSKQQRLRTVPGWEAHAQPLSPPLALSFRYRRGRERGPSQATWLRAGHWPLGRCVLQCEQTVWTPGEVETGGGKGSLVVRGEAERVTGRDAGRHQPGRRENQRVTETPTSLETTGLPREPRRETHKRQRDTEVERERGRDRQGDREAQLVTPCLFPSFILLYHLT